MKMPLCLSFWCYTLLFVALSSESQLKLMSEIDEQDDNSTVRYQLGANTVRNYDDEKDLILYNLNENSTKDNGDWQYAYRINSTRNYYEDYYSVNYDDEYYDNKNYGSYAYRMNPTRNYHEDNYSVNYDKIYYYFRNSVPTSRDHIRTWMAKRLTHRDFLNLKVKKLIEEYYNHYSVDYDDKYFYYNTSFGPTSTSHLIHREFRNFDLKAKKIIEKNHKNAMLQKMCENITCIRFCCPFDDRLVDGKCLAKQDDFHLRTMYGYTDKTFKIVQNGNERINELFLLFVHDPCQTKHNLIMPCYKKEFPIDGSLCLASDEIIVESTSYCFAVVEQNIFAVKACPKRIMDNKNRNESAIISTNEELEKIKDKNDSMSYNSSTNFNKDNNKTNIISYKMSENIFLCCPFGKRLVDKKCIARQDNSIFLRHIYKYINGLLQKENESKNKLFLLVVRDLCQKSGHDTLNSFWWKLLDNGSLYLPDNNTIVESTSYCFADVDDQYDIVGFGIYGLSVKVCFENIRIVNKTSEKINFLEIELIIYICSLIGPILCSLMTFVVYFTIPELRNIHGYILRSYSGSLIVAYTVELTKVLITRDAIGDSICIAYAFVKYYLSLGSHFWLNVMNFDMWRTFRKLRSIERNRKQQKRKKLIMYSVFAWGGPFILAIICGIMEFVPGVPENFRPRFGDISCWFNNEIAYLLYFSGIETISIISSICLFICMARNIAHYEKAIAHCLRDSENRRYNNIKNRFDLQLKICTVLFIVMCIKLVMITIVITFNIITINIIYMDIIYMITSCTFSALDFIEQFGMFIIFVWKRKIKLLLLKRFGC